MNGFGCPVGLQSLIAQLLCFIPETQNGIFPIAYGLFHPSQKVRLAVVELLERISTHMVNPITLLPLRPLASLYSAFSICSCFYFF